MCLMPLLMSLSIIASANIFNMWHLTSQRLYIAAKNVKDLAEHVPKKTEINVPEMTLFSAIIHCILRWLFNQSSTCVYELFICLCLRRCPICSSQNTPTSVLYFPHWICAWKRYLISTAYHKTVVWTLLMHWSCCSFVISRYIPGIKNNYGSMISCDIQNITL